MEDYTFKICLLGDSGTGKSSLLNRYCESVYNSSFSTTIGVDFKSHMFYSSKHDKNFKLHIWDTAGQEKFKSIVRSYFRKIAGCILVFDLSSFQSFKNLENWLDDLTNYSLKKPLIVLAGNKSDLKIRREVFSKDIDEFKEKYSLEYFEISVKENINLDELFEYIVDNVYNNLISKKIDMNEHDIKKNNKYESKKFSKKMKKKKDCCLIC